MQCVKLKEIHFSSVDSTNAYAKRECGSFDPNLVTCVIADQQTAGYGRRQRAWISPANVNLYATFYFRLPKATPQLMTLTQVISFSLSRLLIEKKLHPQIKWPNDVQLNGKKVAGVLCETIFHAAFAEIFLGIGLNVNMELADLEKIDQPATSLKIETGHLWRKSILLKDFQERFLTDLERFQQEGFAPFRPQIENLLAYKGKTVQCFDGEKEWVGICESLTEDGRLNLRLPDQTLHPLLSGDLSLRGCS